MNFHILFIYVRSEASVGEFEGMVMVKMYVVHGVFHNFNRIIEFLFTLFRVCEIQTIFSELSMKKSIILYCAPLLRIARPRIHILIDRIFLLTAKL